VLLPLLGALIRRQNGRMALDEAEGRRELLAIAEDLHAVRSRLRSLLLQTKRTHGFRRSLAAMRATTLEGSLPRVSRPFKWAGRIEVAMAAVSEARNELRMAARLRKRR
jgi:hypothetical protein